MLCISFWSYLLLLVIKTYLKSKNDKFKTVSDFSFACLLLKNGFISFHSQNGLLSQYGKKDYCQFKHNLDLLHMITKLPIFQLSLRKEK